MMLRVHCMQLFYDLSDPVMENALHEIESMRHFGMRMRIGVDDTLGLVDSIDTTAPTFTILCPLYTFSMVTSNECLVIPVILGFTQAG